MGHNFISGSANPPQVVFQPHVCVMQILDNCGRVKLSLRASQAQPQLCIIAVIPANERERERGGGGRGGREIEMGRVSFQLYLQTPRGGGWGQILVCQPVYDQPTISSRLVLFQ